MSSKNEKSIMYKRSIKRWNEMKKEEKIKISAEIFKTHHGFPDCDALACRSSPFVSAMMEEFNLPKLNMKKITMVSVFLANNLNIIRQISEDIACISENCNDVENYEEHQIYCKGAEVVFEETAVAGTQFCDNADLQQSHLPHESSKEINPNENEINEVPARHALPLGNQVILEESHVNELLLDQSNSSDLEAVDFDCCKDTPVVIDDKKNGSVTIHFPSVFSQTTCGPKNRKRSYKCANNIGMFIIDGNTWKTMLNDEGKLVTSIYPTFISDKFYNISKGCVVQMQNVNYKTGNSKRREVTDSRKQILTIYAYCGHNNQTSFKFICYTVQNSTDVEVLVFTNVEDCYHPTKKTREMSGIARDIMKNELINNSSSMVRLKCVEEVDPEGVKLNNLQNVKSYSTFRKAKSEALAAKDLDKNPMFDLFLMRDVEEALPEKRYLQHVSHPFEVMMYCSEILDLMEKGRQESFSKTEFTLHIDATGSVVRKIPQCEGKRVLYYALVFRVHGFVLPAAEYITSSHTAESIGAWLLKYKRFLIDNAFWPLCGRIVSDFSWVITNDVMLQWNKMDVVTYLRYCHNSISDNEDIPVKTQSDLAYMCLPLCKDHCELC